MQLYNFLWELSFLIRKLRKWTKAWLLRALGMRKILGPGLGPVEKSCHDDCQCLLWVVKREVVKHTHIILDLDNSDPCVMKRMQASGLQLTLVTFSKVNYFYEPRESRRTPGGPR